MAPPKRPTIGLEEGALRMAGGDEDVEGQHGPAAGSSSSCQPPVADGKAATRQALASSTESASSPINEKSNSSSSHNNSNAGVLGADPDVTPDADKSGHGHADDPSVSHALPRKRVMTSGTAGTNTHTHVRNGDAPGLGGPGAGPPRRATMESAVGGGAQLARSFTLLLTPEHRLAPAPTTLRSIRNIICYSWLNMLLIFIPISWALHFGLENSTVANKDVIVFVTAFFAIIPLAQMLSLGTEEIALRVGETLGGLMNATLGNAVELIVAIIALFNCELTIVQTSLIGSVLSNVLLVLGMCFFAGGLRYSEQTFQVTAAQINSSLLVMAVITVLLPAGFHATLGSLPDLTERADILSFSRGTAVILLTIYLAYLFFTLSSHKHLFTGDSDEEEEPQLNTGSAIGLLLVATVLIGVTSEWLVSAINGVANAPNGPSKTWIGLILLPIVSNAAEHATAVTVAVKDKLDLSMGVAVGSSIQISIFVIPLLVVIAWIANKPLSMLFDPFVSIFLFLAVLIVNSAIQDGKTNWLEGYLLMMVYVIAAVVFWYVNPDDPASGYVNLFSDSQCTK
ncbi:calcium/proton exchanger [Tilletiaria anomala UBC 951]|uniref:Vacuolar calcium ion transporter n=1 Tax=Tilletiaria anomala (strain ATCC 24038 / CBS 436.72 / UBC 951) TaxID=1037660 RepID=A0A066VSV7_TILAU|nr:calcium/proton exchanger [Tilletiaria anomala UBC 951]KDN41874.1 calcium/proton exchanger [Tilletiaria anomala UBC 951]